MFILGGTNRAHGSGKIECLASGDEMGLVKLGDTFCVIVTVFMTTEMARKCDWIQNCSLIPVLVFLNAL